jgi:hypothetical protein
MPPIFHPFYVYMHLVTDNIQYNNYFQCKENMWEKENNL